TKLKVLVKLFQKLVGSRGKALVAIRKSRHLLYSQKIRKGAKTIRWIVLVWGTLSRGSPENFDFVQSDNSGYVLSGGK
ncbi:MAG: hypothetical protein UH824_09070, partial [Acutalibacteraceae bacterium]|nr:hypothetical protein [Acutalibacteraceae bacterium]